MSLAEQAGTDRLARIEKGGGWALAKQAGADRLAQIEKGGGWASLVAAKVHPQVVSIADMISHHESQGVW